MTMRSNKAIVNAAGQTITTAGLAAGGALNPEQAKKFIQQTFEATPLSGLVRHELRSAKTGAVCCAKRPRTPTTATAPA